ncbi:hypothetical protein A2567_00635 [Candidatus Azambacteria bacterium RIFOXYD1_FULL_42_11]|uniref:Uncharacterized protein n=1 Tax=Candidatus Azambacteria bacterium RIFOXYD1_FULL_42_11 TaxID=1797310 RepID=A0A1F5CGB0_9BACT|nr:MAG: hypothetical protein A2567_00635 [Candidatus Azambacteria bacterium RIFOXYD1_FULL_42_11]
MLAHSPTFIKLKNKTWPVFLFSSFLENPDFLKIQKIKTIKIKKINDFKKIIWAILRLFKKFLGYGTYSFIKVAG